MKRILTAFAALTLGASAVNAADIYTGSAPTGTYQAPVIKSASTDWSGAYIQLFGGRGWGDADVWLADPEENAAIPEELNTLRHFDLDGWFLGIGAGYNFQPANSKFVFGIVTDVSWGNINDSNSYGLEWGNRQKSPVKKFVREGVLGCVEKGSCKGLTTVTLRDEFSVDTIVTLRGRAGYLVTPELLAYGTGGVAFAWTEVTGSYTAYDGDGEVLKSGATSDTDQHTGWVVGGGLEYRPVKNWSFFTEYLYMNFGEADYFGNDVKADFDLHTVKAGLSYHF